MELKKGDIDKTLIELRRKGKLIKMQLTREDFECLTMIIGSRNEKNLDYFVIDYPTDFEKFSDGSEQNVLFEFTDSNKQHFVFETSLQEKAKGEIWVRYPERMERLQRRKNFRIEVPGGTLVRVQNDAIAFEREVLDVSLGGTLIVVALEKKDRQSMPNLKVGDEMTNLELVFPAFQPNQIVHVQKATIVRLDDETPVGRHQCAMEFTRIRMGDEKSLTEIIYKVQRQFLRERLKVDM